jgi:hypothetical protein
MKGLCSFVKGLNTSRLSRSVIHQYRFFSENSWKVLRCQSLVKGNNEVRYQLSSRLYRHSLPGETSSASCSKAGSSNPELAPPTFEQLAPYSENETQADIHHLG